MFNLVRYSDASGVSGIGSVAEGVQFTDGTCVLNWTTAHRSTAIYASLDTLIAIHGHEGATKVEFVTRSSAQSVSGDPRRRWELCRCDVLLSDCKRGCKSVWASP